MQLSAVPTKISIPWAQNAAAGYIRQPPNASQIGITGGAASYSDGFPPLTFTAVAAGGVPPWGADMNGVLNQITRWLIWSEAGGPILYDPVFQGTIGGYPYRARVASAATPYLLWQSTVDNNLTNPDTGGAGWQTPHFPDPATAGLTVTAMTGNGANIALQGDGFVAPNKWIRAHAGNLSVRNNANNADIFVLTDAGNTSVLGSLTTGNTLAVLAGGASINGNVSVTGEIQAGYIGGGQGTDSVIRFANPAGQPTGYIFRDNTANQVTISAGNTPGIGIDIDAFGNLVASGGMLSASKGASDAAATVATAVLKGDFTSQRSAAAGWYRYPDGFMMQWGTATVPGSPGSGTDGILVVTFPRPFLIACMGTSAQYGGFPPTQPFPGALGSTPLSATQMQIGNASADASNGVSWMAWGW